MKKTIALLFLTFKLFAHPFTPCDETTGLAENYPCKNIDLQSLVEFQDMGGNNSTTGSDIWGWTDPETNKEYALMTLSSGTAFVDISDPKNPVYLGGLRTATSSTIWRDVKTYNNHAYIVSEADNHGMQVFDLTQLRNVTNPPSTFTSTNRYTQFGSAHNIVINEDTGFAYAVGTHTCNGGLHMIDLQNPDDPKFAGCFSSDGYTHDAQCVTYIGPDTDHTGKEICINSNEDTITIVDVTSKNNPVQISRKGYSNSQYTHQGWLTEDQKYFLMNDELDEIRLGHFTKTYIWDMQNLDSPQLIGFYSGPKRSIDHNIYIKGNLAYLTNYTSGLSIVDISDIENASFTEVANFDTYPQNDNNVFDGAWSNYPYFESGTIIVSDSNSGLFILAPTNTCPVMNAPSDLVATASGDNEITISWPLDLNTSESYSVYRSEGGCDAGNFIKIADNIATNEFIDTSASGQILMGYTININSANECQSERSMCVEIQTSGQCTAAPEFSGIGSVNSSNTAACGVDLQWTQAQSLCQNNVEYSVYKSIDPDFIADEKSLIAQNVSDTNWHDVAVTDSLEYYYLVRSKDNGATQFDNNVLKLSDKVQGIVTNGTWEATAEEGDDGFTQNNRHLGWEQVTNRAHSGKRSYWSQANPNSCNGLVTAQMQLTANENSTLSFWTAHDIENQFDGGVIEVSNVTDQWQPINLSPDYPSRFNVSNNSCGYNENEKSFTGTDLEWKQHSVDLSQYQGQDIAIRWNYSTDEKVNEEGWFLDDIKLTNVQVPSSCQTIDTSIQAGLWYDPSRVGHGFSIEPIGAIGNNLYFTVFYTYKQDGTPEWYTSVSQVENAVLNINLDNNTLKRFTYDYAIDPSNEAPNSSDQSIGTNVLSIDFNSDQILKSEACSDGTNRLDNSALASWQLGEQQDNWCIQPLINQDSYPTPDLGGTWWAGNLDSGWGLSLSFANSTIVAILYYYDSDGKARWALGQNNNFTMGQAITFDLSEFTGYPRDAVPVETSNTLAGTITLTLNSTTQNLTTDGTINIDVDYQGEEGGNWHRKNLPITNISRQH